MKRLYLTSREYDALLVAQGGKCCVNGCNAKDGLIAEHSTPNALKPGKPAQLMCVSCHKLKTLKDVKAIAKVKRLNGCKLSQYERRKKFGPRLRGPTVKEVQWDPLLISLRWNVFPGMSALALPLLALMLA